VWAALKLLDDEYKLSDGYILLGHSAGATLSYQLLMGEHVLGDGAPAPSAPLPSAIVGIAGIYDLVAIDHRHQGQYAGFITSAFGEDRDGWRRFSPSSYSGSFGKGTTTLAVSVLAWSQDDSLVDEPEVDAMTEKLVRDGAKSSTVKTLTGEHDVVWKEGTQIPPLVAKAMASLKASA
jgi:acetyl esterase/lipase